MNVADLRWSLVIYIQYYSMYTSIEIQFNDYKMCYKIQCSSWVLFMCVNFSIHIICIFILLNIWKAELFIFLDFKKYDILESYIVVEGLVLFFQMRKFLKILQNPTKSFVILRTGISNVYRTYNNTSLPPEFRIVSSSSDFTWNLREDITPSVRT